MELSATRDLYAILSVSPDASQEEVRQKYRELVRQYHPDVSLDKIAAHHRFVEIVDAYKTLSDSALRLQYDSTTRLKQPETAQRDETAAYSWEDELRRQSLDSLITAAELYFIRGQVEQSVRQCKDVLRKDPQNPHAHGMLGDIYREVGREDDAIQMYTYAAQFAANSPGGGAIYLRKIDDLTKISVEPTKETPIPIKQVYVAGSEPSLWGLWGSFLAMAVIIGSLFYVAGNPGSFVFGKLPRNYLVVAAVDGLLAGLFLTWMHWVKHSDAELFSTTIADPAGTGVAPLGFYLGVAGVVLFYAAIVIYVVIACFEETLSLSVAAVFGFTLVLLAVLTILCPDGRSYLALGGGNVIFTSMLLGWVLGSIGRNPW